MQLPTIHINGTSADSLLDDYGNCMNALLDAINTLQRCGPNGRDYYINGGDIKTAIAEHDSRVGRLVAIRDEINTIAEHVAGLND